MIEHEIDYDSVFAQFCASLNRLAAPAEEQLNWLRHSQSFALPVDELALDFDDSFFMVPQLVDEGYLNSAYLRPLIEIDRIFTRMTVEHNGLMWTGLAVRTDPSWQKIRKLAREILDGLDCSGGLDAPGTVYIPAGK